MTWTCSRLYVGCKNRMGNWESRQSSKPSVLLHYRMATVIFSLGQKTSGSPSVEVPPTSCIVIDGTVVIQFLKPATEKASTSMHSRSLCPTYILKTSSRHATGPGVGPLHNGLIKGYSKSQAKNGVRRRVVDIGTEPVSLELREQDRAVQLPLWRPPRLISACRHGAGHHWTR